MTEPHHKPRWYVMLMVASTIIGLAFTVANYFKPAPKQQLPTEVELQGPLGINAKLKIKDAPPPVNAAKPDGEKYPTGYTPDPKGTDAFLKSLDKPTIRDAGPELFEKVPGTAPNGVFLYRPFKKWYWLKYGIEWIVGTQKIGDCVSWGWGHAVSFCQASNCELGLSSEFDMAATEAIYGGSRVEARGSPGDGLRDVGGWGDGSYGGAAAKAVHGKPGVLWRRKYPFADLTTYSGERAKQWGAYGCGGQNDNGKADKEAANFTVASVALVRNFEEAAAAIKSGYPVPVCSGQGFSSRRDKDGFAAPSGSWAHCMCFIGWRGGNRPGLLCLNSWGPSWISGDKWPSDQPDGSFWVDVSVVNSMLRGNDSFAVSGVRGFPFRDLSNGDWVRVDVRAEPSAETSFALAP